MAETSKADGGRLTTHVLDTATGRPAKGLSIGLFRIERQARTHLKTVTTNDDGRCDAPLLAGADFRTGEYELVFAAGDYHGARSEAKRVLKSKDASAQSKMEAGDLLDRTEIDHGPIAAAVAFVILLGLMLMFFATNGK